MRVVVHAIVLSLLIVPGRVSFCFSQDLSPSPSSIPGESSEGFWSFQPIANPAVPAVKDTSWPKSAVDRFILAMLESQGLHPAPAAEKRTLIRRATFDLTGLPPTPAEIEAFLGDDSPEAFAKVVDRLLGLPRYGERWGRFWLDVARYADSNGLDENLAYPQAFRYRDYVVAAFNEDKPYDQFIHEQLAGDLLAVAGEEQAAVQKIIATGFLALGPKSLREVDGVKMEMDFLDEQVATVGKAIMGLTLECARCHDHKFDPIPTADYYSLAGIFKSTKTMERHIDERGIGNGIWREQKIASDPEAFAMAVTEGTIQDVAIHVRGDPLTLGAVVPRRYPAILAGQDQAPLGDQQSGRLPLAQWLTHAQHPLTSRVMVNRIWLWHFGQGLVSTPDNFGKLGEKPVNPALLDWLARQFMEEGWSIKAMQRTIMLSACYQMSTAYDEPAAHVDAENRLLWRFSRRRLEAEALRDALLFVSGTLDPTMGGSLLSFKKGDYVDDATTSQHLVKYESTRRSLYLPVIRNTLYDVFQTFDFPDPSVVCGNRTATTVAPQALLLMNSPFVIEQSERLARRLLEHKDLDDRRRLLLAYEIAYGRAATDEEIHAAVEYLGQYQKALEADALDAAERHLRAWQSLCQVLISSNEFIYVE